MLAVRCSFKPEMHQFHSFTVSLKNLRASYPGAVSCLNQKGLGIGKTKNKYLENIYIYMYIFVHFGDTSPGIYITRLVVFKGFIIFDFTKMCRGYIYICICVIYNDGYFERYMYNIYGFRGALQHQFFDPGFFSF